MTKEKENRVRESAEFLRKTLARMSNDSAESFVLSDAEASTLRSLTALQDEIERWEFNWEDDGNCY